jgi:hypothetical protein
MSLSFMEACCTTVHPTADTQQYQRRPETRFLFHLLLAYPLLQEKLGHVAATVGKIGGTVAATCFVALLIKWCVINRGFPLSKINDNGPVQVGRAEDK